MSLYALPGPLYAPLYQPQQDTAPSPGKKHHVLVDMTQVEIDAMKRLGLHGDTMDDISNTTCAATHHDQHLKIQIKEARIDFHKLTRPSSLRPSNGRQLGRRQKSGRLQGRQLQKIQADQLDSYESALEFDLVISFVGRTYTAKRCLQQIAQLRQDLLHDLQVQQQWTERRNRKAGSDDSSTCSSMDDSLVSSITNGSGTSSSTSSSTAIPELPRMSDQVMGVYGCGFAKVCGMLHSYRPALERWFLRVVSHVSEDSPVLADFLWEPLSAKCIDELHSSLTELGSIDE